MPVYAVPFVKPDIVHVVEVPEATQTKFPGVIVTVEEVIGEPPLNPAVQVNRNAPSSAVAIRAVAALGTVLGVTDALTSETAELPAAFIAMTVKVYEKPLVNPVTLQVRVGAVTVQNLVASFETLAL